MNYINHGDYFIYGTDCIDGGYKTPYAISKAIDDNVDKLGLHFFDINFSKVSSIDAARNADYIIVSYEESIKFLHEWAKLLDFEKECEKIQSKGVYRFHNGQFEKMDIELKP